MKISKETSDFIQKNQSADIRKLALQSAKYPNVDFPVALQQIAGRQMAAAKIPSWYEQEDILYPAHLSLEQCSSEITARYKATLFTGKSLIDLTGGFGIDCAFLAAKFNKVTYVERQPELCRIARHNFDLLSLYHVTVECADAESYLTAMPPADCIYLDPARRDRHGKKTVSLADCEPDVSKLKELLLKKASAVWMKFSPMLDITSALLLLPQTTEVCIVAVENECKELLLKMENHPAGEPVIHCVNLRKKEGNQYFSFSKAEETNTSCAYAHKPGQYLYEPNAAILKGGAFKSLTRHYPLQKLHPHSHLYTGDQYIEDFPGRIFVVTDCFSPNKKNLNQSLTGIRQANISVRNFPLTVDELRKKTGLKDGGEIYLFATTLSDNKKVLIKCEKYQP